MKKLLNYSTGILLIFISIFGMIYFMFSNSLSASLKFFGPARGKGGIVYNFTAKDIKIVCDSYVSKLPAGKSSIEAGLKDVDAIILKKNQILKFCNYGVIEVREDKNGELVITPKKLSWICKLANDYNIYSSVKEAFTIKK